MKTSDAVSILWESIQDNVHDPDQLRGLLSMDAAYAVQLGVLTRFEELGDRLVGWKVGLTAKAIQEQLGFHEPVFGFLTRNARHESGVELDFGNLKAPGFENELCLTIGETLTGPDVTFDQAMAAISEVSPAFEIIEKRSRPPLDMPLAMADNGQQKGFVVGEGVQFTGMDLAKVSVDVFVNGTKQETAIGAEVLGTPVESVVWLANKLSQFERSLEAGSFVMSGSFTKQYDLSRGDRIEADFAGIGRVTAYFP
ncbi:MAG: fumarylacetoacetate hydrolase family protein [Burkholderiaceae bacterium]